MPLLDAVAIKKIEEKLIAAGVSNESLSIDLLDHICCMIEERLDLGNSLEKAAAEVFNELNEVQLKSIELETKRLTQNKLIMKKRTKIIGLVALLVTLTGFAFKLLHWPGAGILWGSGILIGAFGFFLMLLFDRFNYEKSKARRSLTVVGYLGAASWLLGTGFRVLHWPIAVYLIGAGGLLLLVYFILSVSQAKTSEAAG